MESGSANSLPIVLYWCLNERNRSAVLMLQAQIGVSISVAADAQKMGTHAFYGADILAPERGELKTVWCFGGEAQLVVSLLKQRDFRWRCWHSASMRNTSLIGLSMRQV